MENNYCKVNLKSVCVDNNSVLFKVYNEDFLHSMNDAIEGTVFFLSENLNYTVIIQDRYCTELDYLGFDVFSTYEDAMSYIQKNFDVFMMDNANDIEDFEAIILVNGKIYKKVTPIREWHLSVTDMD